MVEKSFAQDPKEEMLDVVDEQGNIIGRASRYECHRNPELLHPIVHFTVVDLEHRRVLLSKRAAGKEFDRGKMAFFGEHVRSNESSNFAIIRGVEEELGFRPRGFLSLGTEIFEYGTQRELATFYLVTYRGEEFDFDSEEIESLEWVPMDDVKDYENNVGEITQYWIDRINWEKIRY